jgi:ABC-2 type transport system ATP-binding protein
MRLPLFLLEVVAIERPVTDRGEENMSQPSVLSIRDVSLQYGNFVAVRGLSLDVRHGEIFGLLGPNGYGKSSTLSAIVGAVTPAKGEIRISGLAERDDPMEYRRRLGLVPQDLALYEDLSVRENLLFFGHLYGLSSRLLQKRSAEALDFVQLNERSRQAVRLLSGGMQRRLNLACALLHEPDLILLDEPTVGLDIASRDAIFDNLRSLRNRGRAIIITTHHLEEAEALCDRVAIMDCGKLIGLGSLDKLWAERNDAILFSRTRRPAEDRLPVGRRLEHLYLDMLERSTAAA